MFDFLKRRKAIDAAPFVRRIIDLTSPNRPVASDIRCELRYNRCIPVIICPWLKDRPEVDEAVIAISQDLSDRGMRVLAMSDVASRTVVATIWPHDDATPEPLHFRAEVRSISPFLAGVQTVGLELLELINEPYRESLELINELASKALRSPAELATLSA